MEIAYSRHFERVFKKLPEKIKRQAILADRIFRLDPFDSRIKSHKLHGRSKDFWSFSVNSDYRIIFEFLGKNLVIFHTIGNHEVYK